MSIDWNSFVSLATKEGQEVLEILRPYLPALAREGPDVYEGFMTRLDRDDWDGINQYMFARMTPKERADFLERTYQDARQATLAKYRRKELYETKRRVVVDTVKQWARIKGISHGQ